MIIYEKEEICTYLEVQNADKNSFLRFERIQNGNFKKTIFFPAQRKGDKNCIYLAVLQENKKFNFRNEVIKVV